MGIAVVTAKANKQHRDEPWGTRAHTRSSHKLRTVDDADEQVGDKDERVERVYASRVTRVELQEQVSKRQGENDRNNQPCNCSAERTIVAKVKGQAHRTTDQTHTHTQTHS